MTSKRLLRLAALPLLLATVASAHPGHDGHELVWEYNGGHIHLEPYLWTLGIAVLVAVAYRRATRRS